MLNIYTAMSSTYIQQTQLHDNIIYMATNNFFLENHIIIVDHYYDKAIRKLQLLKSMSIINLYSAQLQSI